MLGNVLANNNSFTLRALDPDHLTRLLVLHDVAPCAFNLAIGRCITCHAFHLLAVACIVLQYLALYELLVAEQALKTGIASSSFSLFIFN